MEKLVVLIVLLNFTVNYLLFLGADRLCGYMTPLWRRALAAGTAGLYSGLCMIPGLGIPRGLAWHIASLILASVIAYGLVASALGRGGLFLLLQLALMGLTQSAGGNRLWGYVLSGAAVSLICTLCPGGNMGQRFLSVELHRQGKHQQLTALVDTGNTLCDPITGEPVLVISASAARTLTGLAAHQLQDPVQTIREAPIPGLRLIPCRTVGGTGMLLGMGFSGAVIGGKVRDAIVAFAPVELGGSYQALTGGML